MPRAEQEQEQNGLRGVSTPMLASRFSTSGRVTATTLEQKGLTQTGVRKFINKSEEEPALKALKDAAAKVEKEWRAFYKNRQMEPAEQTGAATEGTSCVWCPVHPRSLMPRKKTEAEHLLK